MAEKRTLGDATASAAWDQLAECIERFVNAWESGARPPEWVEFLPSESCAWRSMAAIELIKVDLEFRLGGGRDAPSRRIEDYLLESLGLADDEGPPCDLIYEEFHLRRQAGASPDPQEYLERFPARAAELQALLGMGPVEATTSFRRRAALDAVTVDQQLDEFDLLLLLGQGSFAKVFLARQRSMQRLVALKVSADLGPEPQAMARLDHPNIVRVYDQRHAAGAGVRLLYMQYVPGVTLKDVVRRAAAAAPSERSGALVLDVLDAALRERGEIIPREAPLRKQFAAASWPQAVCLVGARLAAALHYAHTRGVLHRDVKPANVLLAADGSPMLFDFNVSSASGAADVSEAFFGGSLAYMAPEHLAACRPGVISPDSRVDEASDLYSLCVTLWEMLCAERPFPEDDLGGEWTKLLGALFDGRQCPPETPDRLDEESRATAALLSRGLAAAPAERWSSAREFSRELELLLHPRARRLLARDDLADAAPPLVRLRRAPLLPLAGAALAPNLVLSAMNIAYNHAEIVSGLGPELEREFYATTSIANAILYPIGILWILFVAWPILRHIGPAKAPLSGEFLVQRCTHLGDWLSAVSLLLWIASGVIFPTWLAMHPEVAGGGGRFFASHVLCGLIAAALSFLTTSWFTTRVLLANCLRADEHWERSLTHLRNLSRRSWWYTAGAFAAPFLAVLVMTFAADEEGMRRTARYFAVLATLGLVTCGVFLAWAQTLQDDLAALTGYIETQAEPDAGVDDAGDPET